jgi:hypothetical protein
MQYVKPWQLGNTTVRSGLRTHGLITEMAKIGAPVIVGGDHGDIVLRDLLGTLQLVTLGEDDTNSAGRKWRHACVRLGFLYRDPPVAGQKAYAITPSGVAFAAASSLAAKQECFLRAVACITFSRGAQGAYKQGGAFSPLKHVLDTMFELRNLTGPSRLSLDEFKIFVQTTDHSTEPQEIAQAIVDHRKSRAGSKNKKSFDESALRRAQSEAVSKPVKAGTYQDYADSNLRWLKATGLFSQSGRGIELAELKRSRSATLARVIEPELDPTKYWAWLSQGFALPWDDLDDALIELDFVRDAAKKRDMTIPADDGAPGTATDVTTARLDLEEKIKAFDEVQWAASQGHQTENIAAYLAALETPGNHRIPDHLKDEVVIPSSEGPAYLEWAFWRAFLAINALVTSAANCRGFDVDDDFLPLSHAPGGQPDLVFEFETFVLVVEVTRLTSNRQEAAEGSPVRKHVHGVVVERDGPKPVYGLFLAPEIEANAGRTFYRGEWAHEGADHRLDIVPMTIEDFRGLFERMFAGGAGGDNTLVKGLLDDCLAAREDCEALEWADEVSSLTSAWLT